VKILLAILLSAGCFDSLVDDRCRSGFTYAGGQCVSALETDGGVIVVEPDGVRGDGKPIGVNDAPDRPDAAVTCTDTSSDPLNCGVCGDVCPTGICIAGLCDGVPRGHIIAIGHDYAQSNLAMQRVLGNAAALGASWDLGIARWAGTSTIAATTGTTVSLGVGLTLVGRPWHTVAMPPAPSATAFAGIDVVLVDAQTGDAAAEHAAGATWQAALQTYLFAGGVVIVLEGAGDTSDRFAAGAALYTATPVDISGQPVYVLDGADAVTSQVLSPYAAPSSVSLAGAGPPAVGLSDATPVVVHLTR
jgi:hypothetical protein